MASLCGLGASLVFAGTACSPRDDSASRPPAPTAATTPAEPAPPASEAGSELPPPGGAFVQGSGGRYTVLANQAPREKVLQQLARSARFDVEFTNDAVRETRVTLEQREAELEGVLAAALRGVHYALHYEIGPDGERVSWRVVVGADTRATPGVATAPPPPPDPQDAAREAMLAELRSQRAAFEAELETRRQKRERSFAQLEDPNPEVRAEAARWLDPDGFRGLEALASVLENDPFPAVRASAAETLGGANDDVTALGILLQALEDPDPQVVLAALDAIEYQGDETTVPLLQPLLRHRDPEVRERAVEAMEWLE